MTILSDLLEAHFGSDAIIRPATTSGGQQTLAVLKPSESGRYITIAVLVTGSPVTADDLRAVSIAATEDSVSQDVARSKYDELCSDQSFYRIAFQSRRSFDADEFSRMVADAFTEWSKFTSTPASAMAKAYGIPSPRMHNWIREARLRGYLPPASKGA